MNSFRLAGIDPGQFEPLFALSDDELAAAGAVRTRALANFGFPCRVSLEDAAIGDEMLLLSHVHQGAHSPYRSSGPIFVRRGAKRRVLAAGEVPPYIMKRLISVRAYDDQDMMVDASVCEGPDVAADIMRKFADERVAYIHLHNANRGCFSCRVDRA